MSNSVNNKNIRKGILTMYSIKDYFEMLKTEKENNKPAPKNSKSGRSNSSKSVSK